MHYHRSMFKPLQYLRDWRERRILRSSSLPASAWQAGFTRLPILQRLDAAQRQALQRLAILFLHEKVIEGAHGLVITPAMQITIALQACLPILHLGLRWYADWSSVIVYPAGFAPERLVMDEFGVEHLVREDLSGEAWAQGPVILSWEDTEAAGMLDGHNLVIHEFAHKLDMQNGDANGFPPLHKDMSRSAWQQAFSVAYHDFQARCEHGDTFGVDCYAAESPAEFFAVFSEVFFEQPIILVRHYPAVYAQLAAFYRQDPAGQQAG